MNGIMTFGGNHYEVEGYRFEVHRYLGPCLLKKNGEPSNKKVGKGFWRVWDKFCAMSDEQKKQHCTWVSPGTVRF